MIEINITQPELRKKRRKGQFLKGSFKIPMEVVIGSGGGLLLLLVIAHIFLLFINFTNVTRHKGLQKSWDEIVPAKKNVDAVISELRLLRQQKKDIESLTIPDKIIWSKKLNVLSNSLAKGVWLKRITYNEGVLFIEGSAVSKDNKEIIIAQSFTSSLKMNKEFLEDFNKLEPGSIQRSKIKNIEVADFLITIQVNK